MKREKIFFVLTFLAIAIGIVFRFYQIAENDFVFYDEGYYLNWNRPLGEVLLHHQLTGFDEFSKAVFAYVSRCLASGKTLWFMLVDSRIFFGGLEQWYVSRLWAAILGVLTLGLTFVFTRKLFNSAHIAWLTTALLAILPSHVFYSRIGMQESLSTLLVLSGFYFYLFPAKFGFRTFVSGVCFGLAFFSNYRLIMLPVLITFGEIFLALSEMRWPDFRKWLWTVLVFFCCVFIVGNFNEGQNTIVIFSWIFHQANMAQDQFHWFNVFSYPYYLFRLDTFLFAIFFFVNLYFVFKKDSRLYFPFAVALLQMAIFTLASEKGARYVGVVLPFMAMAVSWAISQFWQCSRDRIYRIVIIGVVLLMSGMMVQKSFLLANSRSDYRLSVEYLYRLNPQAKFLSSQNYVQNLYQNNRGDVREVPSSLELLIRDYRSGYRYLILCPQAYISMTESKERFDPQLRGYLAFIVSRFAPKKIYPNFNHALLERFVLEHNENLLRSVRFLENADAKHYGVLRVYDLSQIVGPMLKVVAQTQGRGK